MMARTFSASILLLASLSGCSKVPANEAPTNKAPDLAHAAKNVPDEKPIEDATPPAAAQHQAVVPQTPVVDLPPEDSVGNVDDDAMRFPDEVTDFMVTRDGCDHFRGEEPYDAERRAYLEESIRQLCTGTDAKLADLRRRYRSDRDVLSALKGYEERIEIQPEP